MNGSSTHDERVSAMTGGMVPWVEPFKGTSALRPDGRPFPAQRAELRTIDNWRNALTCLICLALPIGVVGAVAAFDHWVAVIFALPVVAIFQNRMFILSHEGAHRLLFSNRVANDLVGINFFGWLAFGTGTHAYRRAHTHHHRDEFGPKEPDFLLYAFYPIAHISMRRKLRRDSTGISAYRSLRPRLTGVFRRRFWVNSVRFYIGQLFIFSVFAFSGHPYLYFFLWVLPYVTMYQVLNRLRAIAEHGGMTRSTDRRKTAHHVRQNRIARTLIVPLGVGHHLAHHVDSGIPFRNLPRLTHLLEQEGYITTELAWPNYRTLWAALVSGGTAIATRN